MTMRDPKEWAKWILAQAPSHGLYDEDYLAALIREAQEDGAKEWKAFAARVLEERSEEESRVAPVIAALTERAERAERVARSYASWISGEIDDEIDQGRADFLMSKMDEFILNLKKVKP